MRAEARIAELERRVRLLEQDAAKVSAQPVVAPQLSVVELQRLLQQEGSKLHKEMGDALFPKRGPGRPRKVEA